MHAKVFPHFFRNLVGFRSFHSPMILGCWSKVGEIEKQIFSPAATSQTCRTRYSNLHIWAFSDVGLRIRAQCPAIFVKTHAGFWRTPEQDFDGLSFWDTCIICFVQGTHFSNCWSTRDSCSQATTERLQERWLSSGQVCRGPLMKIRFFCGTFGSMIGGVTLMCNSLGKLHHFFWWCL